MKMIKTIIVDDEKDGAEVLEFLVKEHCSSLTVIDMAHTISQAIDSIRKHLPQLVFLDVEMPEGSGFEIAKATEDLDYEIIFITAYEKYAIKAFKTEAVDYLLKPVDVEELETAVKKAEKRIYDTNRKSSENRSAESIAGIVKKIAIPSQKGTFLVDIHDIIRFEAESNYTYVYTRGQKKMIVAKTLKSFENQLPGDLFCRVHSKHLINLNEVAHYRKGDGGTLTLKDASVIAVSRSHRNEFLEQLKAYL